MPRTREALVVAAALGMVWVGSAPAAPETDEPTPEQIQSSLAAMQRVASAQNGRFALGGQVVDDDGNPLGGVQLQIVKIRLMNLGWDREQEEETRSLDGPFQLALDGYARVQLRFSKPGYFTQERSFATRLTRGDEEQLMSGQTPAMPVVEERRLQITLESIGPLAQLREMQVEFTFPEGEDGATTEVAPFGPLSLAADRDPEGAMIFVDGFPRRLRVALAAKEGGFIPFTPARDGPPLRPMKQAPKTGYRQELVLDAETLAHLSRGAGGYEQGFLFFFQAASGEYGKGRIGQVVVDRTRRVTTLGIAVKLQPDGSRHLETLD